MRIYPVTYSPARNYQKATVKVQKNETLLSQEPSFKGGGGFFGTLFGAGVGMALTAMTGGALFWTVPLFSGAGGIGGDMCEKKNKPQTDSFGR